MSDVQATVGADISPFKAAMEQVKAQAKATGSALGIEANNRTGFRDEQRVQRGIDSITQSLANAKDPISAFGGALEGLARSFRVTGALFLGFAIGDFVREQLTKAAESAQEFYDKTNQIFAVGKNSTKEFAEEAVKALQDAEAHYEKEGFLEKLIYGKGQKETIENGKKAAEEVVAQLRDAREASYKANADKLSPDLETQKRGAISAANAEYDEKKKVANKAGDDITEIERARHEEIQKIGADFNKKEADERIKLEGDPQEKFKKAQEERKAIVGERAKQEKLLDEQGAISDREKLAALQKEIDAHAALMKMVGEPLEIEQRKTKEIELQNQKLQLQATIQEKQQTRAYDTFQLYLKRGQAQSDVHSALGESRIFHGEASSLRKIGLGGTLGPQSNDEQVKTLEKSKKVLENIERGIDLLNNNIEST